MPYDTGIANRLRAAGVPVVEVSGWQSRGSSDFNPRGSVNHHTAGGANGATPSLNTVIYGRPDLPGPLCNILQSREPDGNDKAYVVAAGRANHAGSGGWKGLSGNSSVYGLEIEHTGTSTLSQGRQNVAARIHAAMFGGDVNMVCQHYEWTSRKIDAATNVNGNTFRSLVAEAMKGTLEDEMTEADFNRISKIVHDQVIAVVLRSTEANNKWKDAAWAHDIERTGTAHQTLRDAREIARRAEDEATQAKDIANQCLAILQGGAQSGR